MGHKILRELFGHFMTLFTILLIDFEPMVEMT